MAIQLSDYQEIIDGLSPNAHEVLEANWQEAARVFSPRGLDHYLKGAAALSSLGRGEDLVFSFLESAPLVAREIGEDGVTELFSAAIKMYSRTSAEVLTLVFSSAPVAATRLNELGLFKGYLTLLNHLLSQAPRALRPMLGKLDILLQYLTLGGLRRWAMWGISAYRNDFEAQAAYFSLSNDEAQAILNKEQRGVLFVDVQRRLIMYLRALWGQAFFLRPTSGDFETRQGYRPFIEHNFIHLPDAFDDVEAAGGHKVSGLELYRAAAAHAAAHIKYSRYNPQTEAYTALQRTLVGLVEDARVEALAIRAFPGLQPLWRHLSEPDTQGSAISLLLDKTARALADEHFYCDDAFVHSARTLYKAAAGQDPEGLENPEMAHDVGLQLAETFYQLGLVFNSRADQVSIIYRDDNRYLWQDPAEEDPTVLVPGQDRQVRKYVSLMEMWNNLDVEYATDDAQEIWVLATEFFHDDGTSINELEGKEPTASPVHYSEWDYQTQLERPHWVTVLEKRPKTGELTRIEDTISKHKPVIARLKHLIEAVQPQGVVRERKREDGDTIDINAAVDAMIDIRMGRQPDPRINIRTHLQIRDLSVLLLIDLSESTNDPVKGMTSGDGQSVPEDDSPTVLDLAREATVLLAEALAKIGDPFAIHGFDSDGRHDVEYYRYKDFDSPYNDTVKGRLAGMTGQLSTRMGAALRHAGALLAEKASQKKLIILLTDGEPSDNDVRDPQYLRHDTKRAVEELAKQGVRTFCLSLDPHADEYVSTIFGQRNYLVLDNVLRLPEKLPALYLSMTR